jgi:hypothetical protein
VLSQASEDVGGEVGATVAAQEAAAKRGKADGENGIASSSSCECRRIFAKKPSDRRIDHSKSGMMLVCFSLLSFDGPAPQKLFLSCF